MNKQTATGLAIAGFVILIISLIIPLYGLYVGGIALGLAAVGGFFGERVFTILTVVVSAVKVWFLSPTFQLLISDFAAPSDRGTAWSIAVLAHAAPIFAMILASRRKSESSTSKSSGPGMPRGS